MLMSRHRGPRCGGCKCSYGGLNPEISVGSRCADHDRSLILPNWMTRIASRPQTQSEYGRELQKEWSAQRTLQININRHRCILKSHRLPKTSKPQASSPKPQVYFFNTAVGHVLGSMCQFSSSPTVSGCCPISRSSTMMNKPMRGFSTGSKPNRAVAGMWAVSW